MSGLPEIGVATGAQLLGGSGAAGFFAWLIARRKDHGDKQSAEQALIRLAQDAAAETVRTLRDEVKALRDDASEDRVRIGDLERELASERASRKEERHSMNNMLAAAKAEAMLATKRAESAERACETAAGQRRQLDLRIDSLTRRLIAAGVEVPEPPIRSGEVEMLGDPTA